MAQDDLHGETGRPQNPPPRSEADGGIYLPFPSSEHFNLDSGRKVTIQKVGIESTYGGVLEGTPLAVSRHLWRRLPFSP